MELPLLYFKRLFSKSQEYLELEKGDVEDSETSSTNTSSAPVKIYRRSFIFSCSLNAILSLLLIISILFPIPRTLKGKYLIRQTSSYSPILDRVPLTTSPKMINGSFLSETNPPDIFRALPSPEADAAWRRIAHPTWITISEADARSLGKDPKTLVGAPAEWAMGSGRYIAMLDLNHQLHCLNQLRQQAFHPASTGPREAFKREHWMHCVHILYQNIMCAGSTEVITYNWRATQRFPVPDFDVPKVCRNSEALLGFQEREKVLRMNARRDAMRRPENELVLPLPPRLKAFLEAHDDGVVVD